MLPGELAGQCFWFDCQFVHGVDHGVDALPQPIGLTHLSLKYNNLGPHGNHRSVNKLNSP